MKRLLLLCLTAAVLVSCLGLSAQAAPTLSWTEFYTMGDAASAHTRIDPIELDGTTTLFLPASVSRKAVPVYFTLSEKNAVVTATGSRGSVALKSGDTLDLTALCEGTDDTITLRARSGSMQAEKRVTFLGYDNVSTMFLVSDDPVNEGREWVESSEDKSNRAKGSMALLAADGESVYDGKLTQIKGRGNSTWKGAKRPYQIKLDKKTDLLQTGDSADKAKTWVLLANFYDPSAVRNMLALDLGRALQMECNMGYRPVCLFYDGEFRGLYLLTEKVEVNEGRVDVTDLEKANEMANPDVEDLTKLESKTGTTANGATYLYCDGMNDPADITGGYLLEMDFADRAMEEKCYFITTRGFYVVVKSPEACSKAEMDYIASWYQDYEDAVFEGGTSSKTGKPFTDYVTVESMVQCYLVNELSKNGDGFNTSAYLYKETGSKPMKMGPLWDYDLSFGNNNYEDLLPQPELLYTVYGSLGRALYALPEFRAEAQRQYTKYITPLGDVLAGDADAVSADGSVHSFAWYREQVAAAAGYDELLWNRPIWTSAPAETALRRTLPPCRISLSSVCSGWTASSASGVLTMQTRSAIIWMSSRATGTMTQSPAPRRSACCTAKVPASLIRPALRRAHRRHRSFIILPRPAALPIPTCSRMLRRAAGMRPPSFGRSARRSFSAMTTACSVRTAG